MDRSYVPACGERTGVCVCCCGSGGGGWLGGGGGWLGGGGWVGGGGSWLGRGGADKGGGGRRVLGWGWVLGPKIQFSPSLGSTDVVLWLPELLPFRWNKENSRHLVTHKYFFQLLYVFTVCEFLLFRFVHHWQMHLCCNDHTQSHIVTHLPKVILLHLAVSHKSKLNFIANSLSLYEAAKCRYIDCYCICKSLPWYLVYVTFNGKHYACPTKLQLCIH